MTRYICPSCGVAFAGPPKKIECSACANTRRIRKTLARLDQRAGPDPLELLRQQRDAALEMERQRAALALAAELKRQQEADDLAEWLAQDVH